MPRQPTWILIAFVAFLVFVFLFLTRAYGGCAAYDVLKDFKEVFGWAIAMYVAYIAVGPVWKQLELMRIDVDISSIKFLEQEIEALKRLRFDVENALERLLVHIQHHTGSHDDLSWHGNEHAAHDAWIYCISSKKKLKEMNVYFEAKIEDERRYFMEKLSELQNCFYDMNFTIHTVDEPEAAANQPFDADEIERIAAATVNDRIGDFHFAESEFQAALRKAIAARTRLISEKKTAMVSTR